MNRLPIQPIPIDEAFQRLKSAGWSIGEVASDRGWLVIGTNGENLIFATGGRAS